MLSGGNCWKMTQPPSRLPMPPCFAAMTGIARYAQDPEIRKPCGRPMAWAPGDPARIDRSAVRAASWCARQEHQGHPDQGGPGPGAAHDRHDTRT